MKITTIRISDEMDKKVSVYAAKNDLSKNQVIKKALRKLLSYEKQT